MPAGLQGVPGNRALTCIRKTCCLVSTWLWSGFQCLTSGVGVSGAAQTDAVDFGGPGLDPVPWAWRGDAPVMPALLAVRRGPTAPSERPRVRLRASCGHLSLGHRGGRIAFRRPSPQGVAGERGCGQDVGATPSVWPERLPQGRPVGIGVPGVFLGNGATAAFQNTQVSDIINVSRHCLLSLPHPPGQPSGQPSGRHAVSFAWMLRSSADTVTRACLCGSLALGLLGCDICAVCTLSVLSRGAPWCLGLPWSGGACVVPSNCFRDWCGSGSADSCRDRSMSLGAPPRSVPGQG